MSPTPLPAPRETKLLPCPDHTADCTGCGPYGEVEVCAGCLDLPDYCTCSTHGPLKPGEAGVYGVQGEEVRS